MSYIEELRLSKDKPQVAYQEFALSTRQLGNHLFCFFEGKDNSYYFPRIKIHYDDVKPIMCGGRDKVLGVHDLIKNHDVYDKYKKAYFIDKDFNPVLPELDPPIFETPTYSIENFYTSIEVFKQILINEFHLSEVNDPDYDEAVKAFEERQKEFHQSTLLFNAWYASLIHLRNTTGVQTGVNLDDKLPKKFVKIDLQKVTAVYDLETISTTFARANSVEQNLLQAKIDEFSNCNCQPVFRGKYEMQFLIKFIELLIKDSDSGKNVIKSKLIFSFGDASGLNNLQAINVFSAYALTPQALTEYLIRVTA